MAHPNNSRSIISGNPPRPFRGPHENHYNVGVPSTAPAAGAALSTVPSLGPPQNHHDLARHQQPPTASSTSAAAPSSSSSSNHRPGGSGMPIWGMIHSVSSAPPRTQAVNSAVMVSDAPPSSYPPQSRQIPPAGVATAPPIHQSHGGGWEHGPLVKDSVAVDRYSPRVNHPGTREYRIAPSTGSPPQPPVVAQQQQPPPPPPQAPAYMGSPERTRQSGYQPLDMSHGTDYSRRFDIRFQAPPRNSVEHMPPRPYSQASDPGNRVAPYGEGMAHLGHSVPGYHMHGRVDRYEPIASSSNSNNDLASNYTAGGPVRHDGLHDPQMRISPPDLRSRHHAPPQHPQEVSSSSAVAGTHPSGRDLLRENSHDQRPDGVRRVADRLLTEKHLSDAGAAYTNQPQFGSSGGADDPYRRGGASRPSSVVTGVHSADSNQQQQQQQQPPHPHPHPHPHPQQQQLPQQTLPRLLMVQSENASRRGGRSSPLPQAVQGAQPQVSGPAGEPGIRSEFGKMFSGIGSGVGGSSGSPLAGHSASMGVGAAAAAVDGDGGHQAMQSALHDQPSKDSDNGSGGGSGGTGAHAGHGNEDGGTAVNAAAVAPGPNAAASVASSYEHGNGLPGAPERPRQIVAPLRGTKRPKRTKDGKGTPGLSGAVADGGDGRAGGDPASGGRDAKKSKLSALGMMANSTASTPTAAGGRMGGSLTPANLSPTMHHHHHHHHQSISPGLGASNSSQQNLQTRQNHHHQRHHRRHHYLPHHHHHRSNSKNSNMSASAMDLDLDDNTTTPQPSAQNKMPPHVQADDHPMPDFERQDGPALGAGQVTPYPHQSSVVGSHAHGIAALAPRTPPPRRARSRSTSSTSSAVTMTAPSPPPQHDYPMRDITNHHANLDDDIVRNRYDNHRLRDARRDARGQHNFRRDLVIPKIQSHAVFAMAAQHPRHHIGSMVYSPSVEPAPSALASSSMFSSYLRPAGHGRTTKPLPVLSDHINCTFTVRVAGRYVARRSRQELVRRKALWGTEVYTDDSDVVAAAIHMGWLRGAWPDEDERDLVQYGLINGPAECDLRQGQEADNGDDGKGNNIVGKKSAAAATTNGRPVRSSRNRKTNGKGKGLPDDRPAREEEETIKGEEEEEGGGADQDANGHGGANGGDVDGGDVADKQLDQMDAAAAAEAAVVLDPGSVRRAYQRLVVAQPPASGPMRPPPHHDLLITVVILPPLAKYTGSVRFGLRSRGWGGTSTKPHAGMSFAVHRLEWVEQVCVGGRPGANGAGVRRAMYVSGCAVEERGARVRKQRVAAFASLLWRSRPTDTEVELDADAGLDAETAVDAAADSNAGTGALISGTEDSEMQENNSKGAKGGGGHGNDTPSSGEEKADDTLKKDGAGETVMGGESTEKTKEKQGPAEPTGKKQKKEDEENEEKTQEREGKEEGDEAAKLHKTKKQTKNSPKRQENEQFPLLPAGDVVPTTTTTTTATATMAMKNGKLKKTNARVTTASAVNSETAGRVRAARIMAAVAVAVTPPVSRPGGGETPQAQKAEDDAGKGGGGKADDRKEEEGARAGVAANAAAAPTTTMANAGEGAGASETAEAGAEAPRGEDLSQSQSQGQGQGQGQDAAKAGKAGQERAVYGAMWGWKLTPPV